MPSKTRYFDKAKIGRAKKKSPKMYAVVHTVHYSRAGAFYLSLLGVKNVEQITLGSMFSFSN